MREHPKARFARLQDPTARVLDIGCRNHGFQRFCEGIGMRRLESFLLPFPDEFFDGVVSSYIVELLTRPMHLMDDIFRVLR